MPGFQPRLALTMWSVAETGRGESVCRGWERERERQRSVQVAALGAITNIVVDFTPNKSTIIQCGGIKELVHLTKSMDSSLRLNDVWSLRNMIFLADKMCKEAIFMELTASSVATLICDPEPSCRLLLNASNFEIIAEIIVVCGVGKHRSEKGESSIKALGQKMLMEMKSPLRIDKRKMDALLVKTTGSRGNSGPVCGSKINELPNNHSSNTLSRSEVIAFKW
ncbi:unnamed protein product [Vicia faba]|uniref:Uncharacterized protein n=1 Tax=Vicia faba TaxID=3906 RepID=A0AAV1A7A0_VICFA|nr:unnamed protein product [Vicia faba]